MLFRSKVVGVQIEERFEGLGVPRKLQGSGSGCERCAGWRFHALSALDPKPRDKNTSFGSKQTQA